MKPMVLSYSEQGQGMPLVLLHGFPFNSSLWRYQVRSLSDAYRVITPDLRGFGQSEAAEGVYEMSLLAQDVLRLLDELRIEKAAIMGHSMGGYVTLALWRLAPQRFSAFGLIASHVWADSEAQQQAREQLIGQVMERGAVAVVEALMPRLFAPNLNAEEPIQEQARAMMLSAPSTSLTSALRGMMYRPDSSDLLPQIDVPALILCGDSDPIVPPERAEQMARQMPNATLVVIENAAHMPMLEQPQATALAIRNFLNSYRHAQMES
ncbi:MAG: alpha/beta fold hydrolase [Anaerolineae bacterium]|nr:alpha/beta hydrolase [Anaerolineae bacterium]MDW8297809.1 alpha/beta fold hydrolase [Anaerolineae bacterium]